MQLEFLCLSQCHGYFLTTATTVNKKAIDKNKCIKQQGSTTLKIYKHAPVLDLSKNIFATAEYSTDQTWKIILLILIAS
jgi:hypothetical protein